MTDELRAARERLRRDIANGEVTRDRVPDAVVGDLVLLAMNDVAENPADDNELVTVDWLWLNAGFSLNYHPQGIEPCQFCTRGQLKFDSHDNSWMLGNIVLTGVVRTRGDVRRLLAALGIEVTK